jgi:hypothetical protein
MHTPRRWSTCVGAEHPATERGYPRSPLGPRRNSLASADCLAKHRRRRRNRRTPTHGVPRAQGAVQSPAVTAAMSSADSPTIARLASKARITEGRPPRRFSLAAAIGTPDNPPSRHHGDGPHPGATARAGSPHGAREETLRAHGFTVRPACQDHARRLRDGESGDREGRRPDAQHAAADDHRQPGGQALAGM